MHLPERAPYLSRRALSLPEKGTAETVNKGAESFLILQATRYQAKCEARIGMDQDTLLPHPGHQLDVTGRNSRELIMLGMNPQLPVYPSNHPGKG
ncbi:hypothetical protein CsSME_00050398 [Camellia sinensis var. sinensis]